MASLGAVYVSVKPDTTQFAPALQKGVDSEVEKSKSHFMSIGRSLGTAFAAGLVVDKAVDVFREGLNRIKEESAGVAQTNAVLRSTGEAAGVSAEGVEALAKSLRSKSGIDDDVIRSGENVLLTFRNIRDEAGKGNDVFTQTTKATLDLSVAMHEDMSSAALQVGKALNDPVKGMTALQRVGVQFTDSQKATIKQLVDTGHTMEAQKIILGELNKEFGGSAQAYGQTIPGQLSKTKLAYQDLTAKLVTDLLPALNKLLEIGLQVVQFIERNKAVILPLTVAITAVVAATKAWAIAQAIIDAELTANPIGLVIVAVGALSLGIYALVKNWDAIWAAISHNRDIILIAAIIGGPLTLTIASIGVTLKAVQTIWTGGWAGLRTVAVEGAKTILGAFLDMASGIVHGAASAFGWVPGLGGKLKQARSAFDEFKAGVLGDLTSLEGDHVVHVNVRTAIGDAAAAVSLPNKANYIANRANGGYISGPGGPRDDLIPAMLSNGEFVMNAAATSRHLPLLHALNAKGYAAGGLVVETNAASQAGPLGDQLRQVVDSALQRIANTFASFTGVIGGGVQQWSGTVLQVLAALGLSPSLLGKVLSQMTTESGGQPNIVNTSDSNAAAGHPSMGLMQVIGPTFAAYAGPYAGLGILNPFANIYAGLNYAMHRYGSNLNGLGEGHGYDQGGPWPTGTLGWNTSGRTEHVWTGNQMDRVLFLLETQNKLIAALPDAQAASLNGVSRSARLNHRTRTA